MTTSTPVPPVPGSERATPLPVFAYLRDLRKRLLIAFISVGVVAGALWPFSATTLAILEWPVRPYVPQLQFDTLTDPFFTHLKATVFAAIFLTVPVLLAQLWLLLRPLLQRGSVRSVWPFLLLSYPLFVGGGLFCFLVVFPFAVSFLVQFDPSLVPSLRIGDYLAFTVRLVFVFGLVFEMPLISLLLTRMGLLRARTLARNRRYAIVCIFIAAAVLTPPDVLTQLLLAGPLIVLYELSILVSWLAARR